MVVSESAAGCLCVALAAAKACRAVWQESSGGKARAKQQCFLAANAQGSAAAGARQRHNATAQIMPARQCSGNSHEKRARKQKRCRHAM